MSAKVVIEIELGNEAMITGADVGAKLDQLADLFSAWPTVYSTIGAGRAILDRNGNTVGSWKVVES